MLERDVCVCTRELVCTQHYHISIIALFFLMINRI